MIAETLQDFAIKHSDLLVRKAIDGNEQAFSKLMSLWYRRIFNFCHKYFQNHDMAMEVSQKTFISVHKGLSKLKEVESFRPWLYRIALNKCHEEERKMKRKSWFTIFSSSTDEEDNISEVENQAEGAFFNPEEKMEEKELGDLVLECLGYLPEEQRVILIMKEYEGMKFREIAVTLQISENTAKSRLYYGLKAMKKILEDKNYNKEILHYGY
jgi:RNA polymerase sigma-70 factor (ECF subfamily)